MSAFALQHSAAALAATILLLSSSVRGEFTGWVDPDTPTKHKTIVSFTDGEVYDIVMSDEFERDGRSFADGDDPMWTGLDKSDDDQTSQGKKSLQYYNSSNIWTKGGKLIIETNTEDTKWRGWNPYEKGYETMRRNFKSGMLQSWNKFCYTGGILEIDIQFPGEHDVGGLWPAVWLLGNLGRATFEASTNLMWPWSYNTCDREKQRAQELSGCDVTHHYSLHPQQGRGATEIDLVEVMPGPDSKLPIVKNHLTRPYGAMTLQLAPGISNKRNRPPSGTLPEWGFEWYSNLTYGLNTSINPFFYGTYLAATKTDEPVSRSEKESYQCDSLSSMSQLTEEHFQRPHKFRLEWQPGDGGFIHWYQDGLFRFGVEQSSLEEHGTFIPREPSSIIINTAISTSWGFPAPPVGCDIYDCKTAAGKCGMNRGFCESLPAHLKVESLRVYQKKGDPMHSLGCNPPQFPTRRFIEAHKDRYTYMYNARPLKPLKTGGGKCSADKDCGEGSCSAFNKCVCRADWMGPHCLVPTYKDPFPDWDTENWAVLVKPTVPAFLWIAGAGFILLLMMMIAVVVRRQRRMKADKAANAGTAAAVAGTSAVADKVTTWL